MNINEFVLVLLFQAGIQYLMQANSLIHQLEPNAKTVAEAGVGHIFLTGNFTFHTNMYQTSPDESRITIIRFLFHSWTDLEIWGFCISQFGPCFCRRPRCIHTFVKLLRMAGLVSTCVRRFFFGFSCHANLNLRRCEKRPIQFRVGIQRSRPLPRTGAGRYIWEMRL